MAEALGQVPTRDAKLYPPWESNLTDANREKLAALAKRRDTRGHISLESHEMPFVMVDDGSRWLNVVEAERMIYELNDSGWQLLDEPPPDR